MALTAALLGWMFDGFEMGLFPLVARPAVKDLLPGSDDSVVNLWFNVATALFLIGAAAGGVLFGWLGDRVGRVRAMTLSVLTYAVFSGLCGLATSPSQIACLRFISALGMGGEWSLGVALVMEIWPDRSRALMAGLIGAAANFGYLIVGVIGLGLERILPFLTDSLGKIGLAESTVARLTANGGWRILLMLGAAPALLTFFIRLFVPESRRWQEEHGRGTTSHWATADLSAVALGTVAAGGMVYLWIREFPMEWRIAGSLVAFALVLLGYSFPVYRYLQRLGSLGTSSLNRGLILRRMYLAACLSGVALLGTWASIQRAPVWTDQIAQGNSQAKLYSQMVTSAGAIVGTMLAALMGDWIGRRPTYALFCLASIGSVLLFYLSNTAYGPWLLTTGFIAGLCTASFYGWLPLYLPELFPTAVRATGQGFGFNLGRVFAAIGTLQMSNLTALLAGAGTPAATAIPKACSLLSAMYLVGLVLIWFAPETKGQPLPE